MSRRLVCLACLACLACCSVTEAANPITTYSYLYRLNRQNQRQQVVPDYGFYRHFAAGAVGVQSAMMHRYDHYYPDNAYWQQAQNISPEMIINPYVEISPETQKLIDSPYRNFRIQTANP